MFGVLSKASSVPARLNSFRLPNGSDVRRAPVLSRSRYQLSSRRRKLVTSTKSPPS